VGPYLRLGGCALLARGPRPAPRAPRPPPLLPATAVLYIFINAGYDAEAHEAHEAAAVASAVVH